MSRARLSRIRTLEPLAVGISHGSAPRRNDDTGVAGVDCPDGVTPRAVTDSNHPVHGYAEAVRGQPEAMSRRLGLPDLIGQDDDVRTHVVRKSRELLSLARLRVVGNDCELQARLS